MNFAILGTGIVADYHKTAIVANAGIGANLYAVSHYDPSKFDSISRDFGVSCISFEDILRELSGAKQPKPEPDPDPIPAPAFTPHPKSVREAAFEKAYSRDEIDEIAVDYEVPKAIGSETNYTPPIERKDLTFKRTEHFIIKEKIAVDYLEILSEEDGPARAFVMSEIFARKY